jgi:hypothetical protein
MWTVSTPLLDGHLALSAFPSRRQNDETDERYLKKLLPSHVLLQRRDMNR